MCLDNLTTTKPLTAQKNIFCWKKLRPNRKAWHQDHYTYDIDSHQMETVHLEIVNHSYSGNEIKKGYHSWKDRNKWDKADKDRIANYLFVIPKGEKYFEGLENGCKPGYASSNIICLGHWLSPMTWIRAFKYQSENDKL
jgi:hypothetical protein